jgi:hypothetical protein
MDPISNWWNNNNNPFKFVILSDNNKYKIIVFDTLEIIMLNNNTEYDFTCLNNLHDYFVKNNIPIINFELV